MSSEGDDKFSWGANTVLTQCLLCEHLVDGPAFACSAFPGVIPPEIVANEFDHRKPWIDPDTGQPGDEGMPLEGSITFSPRKDVNSTTLNALYGYLDQLDD